MRSIYLLIILVMVASAAGAEVAEYLVRGEQLPVTTVTNGYVQTVVLAAPGEAKVRVSTSFDPIGAEGPYSAVRASSDIEVPPGFQLPPSLAQQIHGDTSAWAAATQILEWVMARVQLDEHDNDPQDALSVLRRRRGRCSGLANVTTALLLTAGFEARTVSGLVVGRQGGVPHRWVECLLPGAGWVPTDPTLGLWTVTPRHIAFADAVRQLPEIDVARTTECQLSRLPIRSGRRFRPNQGIDLICRLADFSEDFQVLATLTGPVGEVRHSQLTPEGRFSGLLPGRWSLTVTIDGRVVQRQLLYLRSGEAHSLVIYLPRASSSAQLTE
jgi:hypothetical protein